jgi:hypothetical protein
MSKTKKPNICSPWTQPFGEALVDWPRFSKWLKTYRR